ncbi:Aste57867_10983 [Aphanomyces stellatus]|uniref:Aste57867_10983 protein n=1 Tax=Aphanomyces stellatus TaxID=120398 RepID=A0A485KTH2_9STRA|nr:hypothetical protein As57867_010942 [Aphanomyces stellatus]VFT87851.1 Aste57867_10983 [Aphanomyces stellatus]
MEKHKSQGNKHGLCVAHGARSVPFRAIGCCKYARGRGLCYAHYKQADNRNTALVVPIVQVDQFSIDTMEPYVEGEEELESLLPMDPMLLEILDFIQRAQLAMPSAMTTSPKGEKRETKKPKKMKTEHGHKNATISYPLAQAAGLTRTTAYAWQEIQFPDVLATTHEMASVDESSNLLDDLLKDF